MGKIYLKKYKKVCWEDGEPSCGHVDNNLCYFWDKDCGKYEEICRREGVIFKQVELHIKDKIK